MIEAYLSTNRVGWRVGAAATQWVDVPDIGAALDTLRAHHSAGASRPARVWLSARLAPPVIFPADTGARSASEAMALVQHAFRDALAGSDKFETWQLPWKPGRPLVAAAMDCELLDTLRRMPSGAQARWWSPRACGVLSIRPWWNIPWAIAAGAPSAHGECFTLEEPDGLLFWRSLPGESENSKAWVAQPQDSLKTQQRRRFDATSPAGSPPPTHWQMGPGDGDLPIGKLSLIEEPEHELPDAPH